MSERKDNFIKKTNFEIATLKNIKSAWELLAKMAEKYDGKVLNKKFITKAQEELTNAGFTSIMVGFGTDWRGNRENRLVLTSRDNYCTEAKCYVEYSRLNDHLYYDKDYIDGSSFRLNVENLKLAVENNNKALDTKISELTRCVDEIDEIIEKYASMRKYVETTLSSIPQRLREYVTIPMPVYDA